MAIIEHKLEKIILILVILFSVYGIQFAFDYSQEQTIFNYRDFNITGYANESSFNPETGVEEIPSVIESIGGFALLQVEGAPLIVNAMFGFIALILWSILTLVVIAYVREMIGLT